MKPTEQQKPIWKHSWFYFASLAFSLLIFIGANLLFSEQLKTSPFKLCFDIIFAFSLLNIYVIRYRENRGMSTLPGHDFRRFVSYSQVPIPKNYELGNDGEIVEIPEKPKINPP